MLGVVERKKEKCKQTICKWCDKVENFPEYLVFSFPLFIYYETVHWKRDPE